MDRTNGSFDKSWQDYLDGFGSSLEGNSWLGLRNLQLLTNAQKNSLRIELSSNQTDQDFIEYDSFYVGTEREAFPLEIGPKTFGTLDDALITHNKLKFSTFDKRNDGMNNCARKTAGGWWFRTFNGCYSASLTSMDTQWSPLTVPHIRSFAKMLIRPHIP